jgi:nicotinamidase-related amidase
MPEFGGGKAYLTSQGVEDKLKAAVAVVLKERPDDAPGRIAELLAPTRVFTPAEAKGGIKATASKTALVLIEYQNEFTTEGGKLHGAVKDVMASNGMLEKSAALASKARSAGVHIFHCPISFKADASDNPNRALGILAGCAADSLFTADTWNAEFHESMKPVPGDVVVTGKKGLDAFPGTDLEAQLKARGIETVVLGGFLTNCCVESTMRTAYEKGFNVITLTDATATTSAAGQAVTEGSYGMFSTPMTVADFEKTL